MGTLTDKAAVVVGASGVSNFGTVIARRLAEEGANVVVAARRQAPLQKLAEDIGGRAIACDMTQESSIETLFAEVSEVYGNVDIAINSAGLHTLGAIAELSAEAIRPSLELSFIGALLFFKHAAAAMNEGGSIITISSLTARVPGEQLAVYSGIRAGIDHAIKVAALEYANRGIRFNSIAAGLIKTDMTGGIFDIPQIIEAYTAETPVGRMGTVDDMAEAVLYLADDRKSGFINGQVLDLSGGMHFGHLPRY